MRKPILKCFNALVISMYDAWVPSQGFDLVSEGIDMKAHWNRTGFVPVIDRAFDAPDDAPVFGDIEVWYKFWAWAQYRKFTNGDAYVAAMLSDVVGDGFADFDVAMLIIRGLTIMQERYDAKFKHPPVDLHKFVTAYIKNGEKSVLRADVY